MISAAVLGVERVVANVSRAAAASEAASRNIVQKGSIILSAMIRRKMSGPKGWDEFWGATSPEGDQLATRTGQSRRSISPGGVVVRAGDGWEAAVGSPDRHVAFLEEGGTISGNPMLAIPTAAAQRRSGTSLFAGLRWREVPGAFLWPNARQRAGALAGHSLWVAMSEGGKLTLMALLKPSVNQRGRHIFRDAAQEIQPVMVELGEAEAKVVSVYGNE